MGARKRADRAVRPYKRCGASRGERADAGIGPYKGQQKVEAHPANRKTAPA